MYDEDRNKNGIDWFNFIAMMLIQLMILLMTICFYLTVLGMSRLAYLQRL